MQTMENSIFVYLLLLTSVCGSSALTVKEMSSAAETETDELHFRSELDSEWIDYIKTYNKSYSSVTEWFRRRTTWEHNIKEIEEHNREAAMGIHTYTMGINQFTDMTFDEFTKIYLPRVLIPDTPMVAAPYGPRVELPKSVDWRKNNAVTPVKDQKKCGSCWAFSTTGAIEGQVAIQDKKLVSLSEQNLVDCSKSNHGCNGGLPSRAYMDIKKTGIDKESCYPYIGKEETCKFKTSCIGVKLRGYVKVTQGEANLKNATALAGPISVGIAVTEKFMKYSSGTFSDTTCNGHNMNHAVLVVGYSEGGSKLENYWLIKNSWGTKWGMSGYIRLAKDQGDMCHVSKVATYPLLLN